MKEKSPITDADLARLWGVERSTILRWRRRNIDPQSPRSVIRGASSFSYAPRGDTIARLRERAEAVCQVTGRD